MKKKSLDEMPIQREIVNSETLQITLILIIQPITFFLLVSFYSK